MDEKACFRPSKWQNISEWCLLSLLVFGLCRPYLPGCVSQNTPVEEGQLDLRLWVIREGNSALFPFKMLLLKLIMSLFNSSEWTSSCIYFHNGDSVLGNPYCWIKMVYCKDGDNILHGFYIIAEIKLLECAGELGRKCLHFNFNYEWMRIQNAKMGDFSIEFTHSI